MSLSVRYRPDLITLATWLGALTDEEMTSRSGAVVNAVVGPSFRTLTVTFSSGTRPAFFVGINPDQAVVCIAGASNASMFTALFQGALNPPLALGLAGVNGALVGPAQAIVNSLGFTIQNPPPSILICGHSYGGGLAEAIAALLVSLGLQVPIQVFTMGAPRVGDTTLSALLAKTTNERFMNVGDAVTTFPPHFNEAPTAYVTLDLTVGQSWSNYVQPGGGQVLFPDGVTVASPGVPRVAVIQDVNLLAWLLGGNAWVSYNHSYRTYLKWLSAAQPQDPTLAPILSDVSLKDEQPLPFTTAMRAAGPLLGPILQQKAVAIMQSVYIPPNYRMKMVKVGITYNVVWMGYTIAIGASKSNAKTLAKAGNKFLRVMQTVKSVDHLAFGNALQAYLNVAASGVTGFQPVLTVT
jgi:hypothetical protein